MGHHDDQGYGHIQKAHDGDDDLGDLDHFLAAAHDAVCNGQGHNAADDPGGDAGGIEAVDLKGILQVEGGQHIEAAGVSKDQEDGESYAQAAAVQGVLDVIGGAAVAVAAGVSALVDLGQGAFHESGGGADEGDEPHPEGGAEAAQANGGGNAHDVAGTHTGGGGDHQGLEGGDGALFAGLFHHHPDGLSKQAELHKARAEGEIQARCDQDDNQNGIVQNVVKFYQNISHVNSPFFFFSFGYESAQVVLFSLSPLSFESTVCRRLPTPAARMDRAMLLYLFNQILTRSAISIFLSVRKRLASPKTGGRKAKNKRDTPQICSVS